MKNKKGKVYLVGAGPGDYGLITLKGLECIKKSDLIAYDRLANKKLLDQSKEGCEFIYVGKNAGNHAVSQDEINKILVDKAKEGMIVTRLKGGDPYVFGRGGEEGQELRKAGVAFEIVPGISSSIGGLAYAGIPITHRDYASSFHIVTGHLKDGGEDKINWKELAKVEGTLVFLMGLKNLANIQGKLLEYGKDPKTPAALVSWASSYKQKSLETDLENLEKAGKESGYKSPVLIVIGDVVKLRKDLNFFEEKPLFGKNIGVTRARVQQSDLAYQVMDLGGNVEEIPTITINALDDFTDMDKKIENISKGLYDYICFNSANGVKELFSRIRKLGLDSRIFHGIKICSIGKASSKELEGVGLYPDIVPDKYVAESLYQTLLTCIGKNDRVLVVKSDLSRNYLDDNLKDKCIVESLVAYHTRINDQYKYKIIELLEENQLDYLTFSSSSTVKNLVTIIGQERLDLLENIKCISIGPITSKSMREFGIKIYKEAKYSTIDGVVESILSDQL